MGGQGSTAHRTAPAGLGFRSPAGSWAIRRRPLRTVPSRAVIEACGLLAHRPPPLLASTPLSRRPRTPRPACRVKGTWASELTPFGYDFWYQPRLNTLVATGWGAPKAFSKGRWGSSGGVCSAVLSGLSGRDGRDGAGRGRGHRKASAAV